MVDKDFKSPLFPRTKSQKGKKLAERWGFEPQIETSPITDFESAAFDHSAIFPYSRLSICFGLADAIPNKLDCSGC